MKLDNSLVGTKLTENLVIEQYLGAGGMGVTYKAFQPTMSRFVCIKFLSASFVADSTSFDRFKREALILSKLTHPGIVQCYFFGLAEGIYPFFAMEFVDGKNLRSILQEEKSIPWESACRIIAQSCTAIGYAHNKGFVHRDIKPDNIMIVNSPDEEIKVLDFGLAAVIGKHRGDLTETGMVVGSLPYMAPEAIKGRGKKDLKEKHSDIYSLGCVLFELIAGHPPFSGDTALQIMTNHCNQPIPQIPVYCAPENVSRAINKLLEYAMAKDPADRFQDCEQLRLELEEILSMNRQMPAQASAGSSSRTTAAFSRSRLINRLVVVALIGFAAALGALFIYLSATYESPTKAAAVYDKTGDARDLARAIACLAATCGQRPADALSQENKILVRRFGNQVARQVREENSQELNRRIKILSPAIDDLEFMSRFYGKQQQQLQSDLLRCAELDILIASQQYSKAHSIVTDWYRTMGRTDLLSPTVIQDQADKVVLLALKRASNLQAEGPDNTQESTGLGDLLLTALESHTPVTAAPLILGRLKTLMPRAIHGPSGITLFRRYINSLDLEDETGTAGKLLLANSSQFPKSDMLRLELMTLLTRQPTACNKSVARALGEKLIDLYNSNSTSILNENWNTPYAELNGPIPLLCSCGLKEELSDLLEHLERRNEATKKSPQAQAVVQLLKIRILSTPCQTEKEREQCLQAVIALTSSSAWQAALKGDQKNILRTEFVETVHSTATTFGSHDDGVRAQALLTLATPELDALMTVAPEKYVERMVEHVRVYTYTVSPTEMYPTFEKFYSACNSVPALKQWQVLAEPYLAHHLALLGFKDKALLHYKHALPLIFEDMAAKPSLTIGGGYAELFEAFMREDGFKDEARQLRRQRQLAQSPH